MTPSNDLTPDAGTRKRDGSSITFSSPTTAVGVFNTPADAEAAVRALKEAGFDDAQIGVASREWSQRFANVNVGDQHAAERGAVAGAAIGGGRHFCRAVHRHGILRRRCRRARPGYRARQDGSARVRVGPPAPG